MPERKTEQMVFCPEKPISTTECHSRVLLLTSIHYNESGALILLLIPRRQSPREIDGRIGDFRGVFFRQKHHVTHSLAFCICKGLIKGEPPGCLAICWFDPVEVSYLFTRGICRGKQLQDLTAAVNGLWTVWCLAWTTPGVFVGLIFYFIRFSNKRRETWLEVACKNLSPQI